MDSVDVLKAFCLAAYNPGHVPSPAILRSDLYSSLQALLRQDDPKLAFRTLDQMDYALHPSHYGLLVVRDPNSDVQVLCRVLGTSPGHHRAELGLWVGRIRSFFERLRNEKILRNRDIALYWKGKALSARVAREGLMAIDLRLVKLLWEQVEEATQMKLAMEVADLTIQDWLGEASKMKLVREAPGLTIQDWLDESQV